jgi:hypothetical protein
MQQGSCHFYKSLFLNNLAIAELFYCKDFRHIKSNISTRNLPASGPDPLYFVPHDISQVASLKR